MIKRVIKYILNSILLPKALEKARETESEIDDKFVLLLQELVESL